MAIRRRLPILAGALLISLTAAFAAGCGDDNDDAAAGTGTTAADPAIAAAVPAAIRSKGTLTVAADASYPPNEFIGDDGQTVQGMDPDLAAALGEVLGLKVAVVNAGFDTIIPGLAAGRYDLGMSSFTDTKEREKVVDFVTYYTAGTSFYVKKDGGPPVTSLADLCGLKVAVERGTTQADDANAQSAKCTAAAKPPVTVLVFPDQNAANLALASDRGEVGMADSPVAADIVKKSDGQFVLSGDSYGAAPYGIAIPKGNGMAQPVLDAMKSLIASGRYGAILEKWGLQAGAIDTPQINGAQS